MNHPNFLCIGAQKAGTTWLQKALEHHPDVYLPRKEIHFFDRDPSYPSPSFLAESNPVRRFLNKDNRTRNVQIIRALLKSALTLNGERFRFFTRFFLTIDDQWYADLFATRHPYKVKGDITPSYSILTKADVRKIRDINPAMKIVFIMRNPVYRDWSACRYNVSRHGHVVDSLAYFDREEMMLRGNYLRTIDNYSAFFPDGQILYCFYDELKASPGNFYERVCRFLDIPPRNETLLTGKVNKSPDMDFTPAVKSYLAARHLPQLEKLAVKFGGYCENWLREAQEIIKLGETSGLNHTTASSVRITSM